MSKTKDTLTPEWFMNELATVKSEFLVEVARIQAELSHNFANMYAEFNARLRAIEIPIDSLRVEYDGIRDGVRSYSISVYGKRIGDVTEDSETGLWGFVSCNDKHKVDGWESQPLAILNLYNHYCYSKIANTAKVD